MLSDGGRQGSALALAATYTVARSPLTAEIDWFLTLCGAMCEGTTNKVYSVIMPNAGGGSD